MPQEKMLPRICMGAVAQSVDCGTPGEEVPASIPVVACNAPQGVAIGTVVGMVYRGPHIKRLEHLSRISAL